MPKLAPPSHPNQTTPPATVAQTEIVEDVGLSHASLSFGGGGSVTLWGDMGSSPPARRPWNKNFCCIPTGRW